MDSCSLVVTVSIPDMLSVLEDENTVAVCVTLISGAAESTERDFTVTLTTDGELGNVQSTLATIVSYHTHTPAALDGSDFTGVSMSPLTFAVGSANATMQCLDVSITDDTALELDKNFTVILATIDPDVMLENDMTDITILDDDGKVHATDTASSFRELFPFRCDHWFLKH